MALYRKNIKHSKKTIKIDLCIEPESSCDKFRMEPVKVVVDSTLIVVNRIRIKIMLSYH